MLKLFLWGKKSSGETNWFFFFFFKHRKLTCVEKTDKGGSPAPVTPKEWGCYGANVPKCRCGKSDCSTTAPRAETVRGDQVKGQHADEVLPWERVSCKTNKRLSFFLSPTYIHCFHCVMPSFDMARRPHVTAMKFLYITFPVCSVLLTEAEKGLRQGSNRKQLCAEPTEEPVAIWERDIPDREQL